MAAATGRRRGEAMDQSGSDDGSGTSWNHVSTSDK